MVVYLGVSVGPLTVGVEYSLTLLPALETLSYCWVASSSLNMRVCLSLLYLVMLCSVNTTGRLLFSFFFFFKKVFSE